jgi:hypothetical protein
MRAALQPSRITCGDRSAYRPALLRNLGVVGVYEHTTRQCRVAGTGTSGHKRKQDRCGGGKNKGDFHRNSLFLTLSSARAGRKGPMDRQRELGIIRAAYAKQILAAARVNNARLDAAFNATRREDFLGAGPWWILRRFGDYVTTPDADPVYLYTDDRVGLLPERRCHLRQCRLHAAGRKLA